MSQTPFRASSTRKHFGLILFLPAKGATHLENDADLAEKLSTLLTAERDLREALEGFDDDFDADLPDSLDSLDAALAKVLRLERWSGLLRDLRGAGRTLMSGETASKVDFGQHFGRR